jgi:glutamyl-tRNA synthetase
VTDQAAWDKVMSTPDASAILAAAAEVFATAEFDVASLHQALQAIGEERGLKLGKAQAPVRVALTGRTVGPPLFESMVALGREVVSTRIDVARRRLVGA